MGRAQPVERLRRKRQTEAVERRSLSYYDVEFHPQGLVWIHRNQVPYPDLEAVADGYRELFAAVDAWRHLEPSGDAERTSVAGPRKMAWIYDVRLAPKARNDEAFEAVHNRFRPELLRRSPVLIVLVATASGMMQMSRLGREDGTRFEATTDPDLARREALERLAELQD